MSVLKRSEYDMIFYFNIELYVGRFVEESSKKVKERVKIVVVGDMELFLLVLLIINILDFIISIKFFNIRWVDKKGIYDCVNYNVDLIL